MFKMLSLVGVLSAAIAGVSALPSNLDARASSSNFSLFAYGSNASTEIGGFPIFYNGGEAP